MIFKRILSLWLICAALPLVGEELPLDLPQLLVAEPPSNTFVLDSPLQVRVHIDGQPQLLLGMDQGRLRLVFPNQPDAEVLLPLDAPGIQLSYEPPEPYNQLAMEQSLGNHAVVIESMESYASSLLPLLVVDANQCNFHAIYLRYFQSVVAAKALEDAIKISEGLPHTALSATFLTEIQKLLGRCIAEGHVDGAERLLSIMHSVMADRDFAPIGFASADALRARGEYALTARIYGSIATSDDQLLREKALLWAGYSSAVAGDVAGAKRVLDAVPEMQRDNRNFLTYCLAKGRLYMATRDYVHALQYLSRAMVLTSVNATFKPELYYLLIHGHRASGQDEAAERLFNELKIFYPDSPWMLKSESELKPVS